MLRSARRSRGEIQSTVASNEIKILRSVCSLNLLILSFYSDSESYPLLTFARNFGEKLFTDAFVRKGDTDAASYSPSFSREGDSSPVGIHPSIPPLDGC